MGIAAITATALLSFTATTSARAGTSGSFHSGASSEATLAAGLSNIARLIAQAGAPASVGDPAGYNSDLTGALTGPRIVYRSQNNHIWELQLNPSTSVWHGNDLTAISGAGPAAGDPFGYTTNLTGGLAGPRVVYRGQNDHIWELQLDPITYEWHGNDLTAIGGGGPAAGDPFGYTGGPAGPRVVYRGQNDHIWELQLNPANSEWHGNDLTAIGGGDPAGGDPFGYTTSLTGGLAGPRVVYRSQKGHVWELQLNPANSEWHGNDLTGTAEDLTVPDGGGPGEGSYTVNIGRLPHPPICTLFPPECSRNYTYVQLTIPGDIREEIRYRMTQFAECVVIRAGVAIVVTAIASGGVSLAGLPAILSAAAITCGQLTLDEMKRAALSTYVGR